MTFNVEFRDKRLARIETDPTYTADFSNAIVKAFRKKMQLIRSAADERDLSAMRSNNFEKLKGDRKNQYSIKLNDQWRLVFELECEGANKNMFVLGIEDYH
jgi:toxin HigB-1